MPTRFTRVTVVADGRQADVSLPAQQPVVTLIPQLCALLSLKLERPGGPWTLSTTAHGILNPQRSLDDVGIADADIVHLAPPREAPEPPFVEDVVDEVAARLDNARQPGEGLEWKGDARVAGCCALAAVMLAFSVLLLTTGLESGPFRLVALVMVGLVAGGLARMLRARGGVFIAIAGVSAWALAGWCGAESGALGPLESVVFGAVGAGLACTSFPLLGRRYLGVGIAGVVLTLFALLTLTLAALGLSLDRTAAVTTVFVLVIVGVAPQIAVGNSGLVALLRAEERAEQVERTSVTRSVDTGRSLLGGIIAGAAVVESATVVVLLLHPDASAPALGVVVALVFALRSRVFTRVEQVVPMLVVATVGLATATMAMSRWLGLTAGGGALLGVGLLLVAVLLILACGVAKPTEITAARLRRTANTVEATAVVLLVPLVLLVFDTYDYVRGLVA